MPIESCCSWVLLVGQYWHIHVKGSVEERHLWVCPCFSSRISYVLLVLVGWFLRWEISGLTAVVSWSVASRIRSILLFSLDNLLWTSIDLINENGFKTEKAKKETISHKNYTHRHRFEQRSVIQFFVAEKRKPCEIYGKMCNMLGETCLKMGWTCVCHVKPESKHIWPPVKKKVTGTVVSK